METDPRQYFNRVIPSRLRMSSIALIVSSILLNSIAIWAEISSLFINDLPALDIAINKFGSLFLGSAFVKSFRPPRSKKYTSCAMRISKECCVDLDPEFVLRKSLPIQA